MIYKWLVKKAYYKNSKQKLSKRGGQRVRRRESEKKRKERKRKENRKEGRKGKGGREGGRNSLLSALTGACHPM